MLLFQQKKGGSKDVYISYAKFYILNSNMKQIFVSNWNLKLKYVIH